LMMGSDGLVVSIIVFRMGSDGLVVSIIVFRMGSDGLVVSVLGLGPEVPRSIQSSGKNIVFCNTLRPSYSHLPNGVHGCKWSDASWKMLNQRLYMQPLINSEKLIA